ncbi:unnamed protein product [Zymoseptoria tritici ST99CH_1E4]|uniref:Uncharacterized protein n=1 Tax=Zymoseptoria tritici ST99CH_1E4 TaxID=1276532 RepID=A0A2H1GPX5_ZYMTR|nr:unnamed protein product [Zymoseptoria tritici ST99CH_1E4]
MMSTPEETVKAMTAFYQQVVKHLSFDSDALKIAPVEGWPDLDPSVKDKSAAVLELLRHSPYLHPKDPYDLMCVYDNTVAVSYLPGNHRTGAMDDIFPIPSHCVYLTSGVGQHGYSLILDTGNGTITIWSSAGLFLETDYEDLEKIPEHEQWREHRTLPAAEVLDLWTKMFVVPHAPGSETVGEIRMADPHRAEARAQEDTHLCEWYPNELALRRIVGEADSEDFPRYKMVQAQYDVAGKTEEVIELLRHIPYLDGEGLVIWDGDTYNLDYASSAKCLMEDAYPLPGHCVYLTSGGGSGYSLILDTEKDTITEYRTPYSAMPPTKLPKTELWREQFTLPAEKFLTLWTKSAARLVAEGKTEGML